MAAERAQLAGLMATSSVVALLLGAVATLVVVYALVLLVKGAAKLRNLAGAASKPSQAATGVLCQNCAILHGKRGVGETEAECGGEDEARAAGGDKRALAQAGAFLKCCACSARFRRAAGSGQQTFYGKQAAEARGASVLTIGGDEDEDEYEDVRATKRWHDEGPLEVEFEAGEEEADEEEELECGLPSAGRSLSEDLRNFILQSRAGAAAERRQSDDPLSDHNSCSLQTVYEAVTRDYEREEAFKNGAAPARGRDQLQDRHWQDKEVDERRWDASSSDEQTDSENGSAKRVQGDKNAVIVMCEDNNVNSVGVLREMTSKSTGEEQSEMGASGRRRAWRKLFQASRLVALLDQLAQKRDQTLVPRAFRSNSLAPSSASSSASSNSTSGAGSDEPQLLSSRTLRTAEIQIPIEAFNDSNTSEFDDVPNCDSRQDTSIDYAQFGQTVAGGELAPAAASSNEFVMDADLRQMNRLNLQLAMLQNNSSGVQAPGVGFHQAAGHQLARHASIGSASSQHSYGSHGHLPQSGLLLPAGGAAQATASNCAQQEATANATSEESSQRRSSSSAATTPTWPASGPGAAGASLRLRVRRLSSSSGGPPPDEPPAESRSSLLYSLASTIGRSRSTDSNQAPHECEPLFEVSLLEARNIWPGAAAASQESRAAPPSGRRDSLLGALMAAAGSSASAALQQAGGAISPSAQRRHSIEGVFARVFKQQPAAAAASEPAGSSHAARPGGDSSAPGSSRARQATPASDYVQLPLLKLAAGQPAESVHFEQLAQGFGYKFTCRLSEFPVRVSLYQASRRKGGARYTLGHCILAPDDWRAPSRPAAPPTHFWPQAQKFAAAPRATTDDSSSSPPLGDDDDDEWELEYRLHQTILEAIKAT